MRSKDIQKEIDCIKKIKKHIDNLIDDDKKNTTHPLFFKIYRFLNDIENRMVWHKSHEERLEEMMDKRWEELQK